MATKTRSQMVDLTLQRLGVLAAGQNATAADSALVGSVVDSIHDQLRKRGLAPFATSAFPSWAQAPFAKILAEEVAPYFGKQMPGRQDGERDLAEQMSAKVHPRPVEFKAY